MSTVVAWLQDGWRTYVANKWILIAGSVFTVLVSTVNVWLPDSAVGSILGLISLGLGWLLMMGLLFLYLLVARNEAAPISAIFSGFKHLKLLWLAVLSMLVMMITLVPSLFLGVAVVGSNKELFQSQVVQLTIIPTYLVLLVLFSIYGFSPVLMMDKGLMVWRSLRDSSLLSKGFRLKISMLFAVGIPLSLPQILFNRYAPWRDQAPTVWSLFLVGLAAWVVNAVVVTPWLTVTWLRVYERLLVATGDETVKAG